MSLMYKLFGVETTLDKLEKADQIYKSRRAQEMSLYKDGWSLFVQSLKRDSIDGKDEYIECAKKFLSHYKIPYITHEINFSETEIEYGWRRFSDGHPTNAVFIKNENSDVVKRAFKIWYDKYKAKKIQLKEAELNRKAYELLKG